MPSCRYFDGLSSRAWPATAGVDGAALRIAGEGIDRCVPSHELAFSPATDRGPARVSFATGGLCEFDDRAAADALFAALGHRTPRVERLAVRTRHAVLLAAAFVVVMAALYVWGVPWIADRIVAQAPRQWDQALGNRVLQTLDRQRIFRPTTLPEARRNRIVDRFDALRTSYQRSLPPHDAIAIEFRRAGVPNALALPGDIVVVTDEIVELAGDDDIALMTVLAHELGHLAHRDAMRQLVRSSLLSLVAAWYLGDVSNAAAAVAGGMGTLSYSREAEHRADLYAVDTMKANHLSTKNAAALFRRLQAWEPPATEAGKSADPKTAGRPDRKPGGLRFAVPEYLSTHPDTDSRIALFEADGATDPAP